MAYPIQTGNTTIPLRFLLVLSADHLTGATGKAPNVSLDKNDGAGFSAPVGAITELGYGWYQVAAHVSDADTIGPLTLHASAPACDPADEEYLVVPYDPTATTSPIPPLRFLLILASDHLTGASGKTPTVTIAKNDGLGFVTPTGAITEVGNGWYSIGANAADVNVLGPLTIHATAASCDPSDEEVFLTASQTAVVTVADLITAALRRIQVLQAGEVPSAEDLADGFLRWNDLLDSLGVEPLLVSTLVRTVWTVVAGTSTYGVGPSGAVNIPRPTMVDHVSYIDTSQTTRWERPLGLLSPDGYASVTAKAFTNLYPYSAYYNPTTPTGTLSIFPVPTSTTLQGVIYTRTSIPQAIAPTDAIVLPPGYRRMLREALAVDLWPEWRDGPVNGDLARTATQLRSAIKASNVRMSDLSVACFARTWPNIEYLD